MPRHGNEANFSCFRTFQSLKCSISQNVRAKPCGFIRGIHVLLLSVPEKFHYLSPKHLNVTSSSSVPTFAIFQKIGYFWIQINPIQYGLFLKHYGMGGHYAPPLVTSLFLEIEGQNLVAWGILMCLLQKWH